MNTKPRPSSARSKDISFDASFKILTGKRPFPWQRDLFERFVSDRDDNIPRLCDLPTGLGKTSVIAVWLLARMEKPDRMPRRLVYVVNRRTVVDQTTTEVQRLREKLPDLQRPGFDTLAISTLRGQFADKAEWSADPSRPAVICGTVDMIGSRLLFEGYRIGFKSRPLHAGFLGQDALLVHDEAHLEPAFQELIEAIQDEQKKERKRGGDFSWPGLRVMALSATARSNTDNGDEAFGLKKPDYEHPVVTQRINASKALHLHACDDEKKKLAADVVERALRHKESGSAILVFLRSVEDAMTVLARLKKELPDHVSALTGTMRGYERDQLVRDNLVFARFMPVSDRTENNTPAEGTVYLVCTSAGEVGVNLSADHMVCDLSTFDSMAQRLGRVNRFGDRNDTRVNVVHPKSFGKVDKKADEIDKRRKNTLDLLKKLPSPVDDQYDASPLALSNLDADQRLAAFAPEPIILPATDILFDAWALTTIKDKMPGRPPVASYLHGVAEWEPKRTSIAWREEVEHITDELIEREGKDFPQVLLADYPLKPHELLSDRSDRVYGALQSLIAEPNNSVKGEKRKAALDRARKNAKARVWLIDESDTVTVTTLAKLLEDDKKWVIARLEDGTILLPPSVGGLAGGMLDGTSEQADDVADHWQDENNQPRRHRRFSDDAQPANCPEGMALIRTIDTNPLADEIAPPDDVGETETDDKPRSQRGRFWHWYARPRDAEDATRASAKPITWEHHTRDVVSRATEIVEALNLPPELKQAVILAAELHDLGKQREIWQRSIGNPHPENWHAKSGRPGTNFQGSQEGSRWRRGFRHTYRHEFGSLLDTLHVDGELAGRLAELSDDMRDVVLHLIAAHHGYARPHFPPQAYDHERYDTQQNQDAAHEVMCRFARLQRKYGRWGLAYLESLLRAADWAASAEPSIPPLQKSKGDA
jgi:CRISPR-associated endonuclease/helicase Cas3